MVIWKILIHSVMYIVKGKIILTFVKMERKTLIRTIAIGVKTVAIGERDQVQVQIQPRQLGI